MSDSEIKVPVYAEDLKEFKSALEEANEVIEDCFENMGHDGCLAFHHRQYGINQNLIISIDDYLDGIIL